MTDHPFKITPAPAVSHRNPHPDWRNGENIPDINGALERANRREVVRRCFEVIIRAEARKAGEPPVLE